MDAFTVLAEPTRRQILAELRAAPRTVNQLANALDVAQPAMSKHLRVLRDAGFVSRRGEAQTRIYRLETQRLAEMDAWLAPFRRLWTRHLDALGRHLDARKESR